jgi:hypothetical protein
VSERLSCVGADPFLFALAISQLGRFGAETNFDWRRDRSVRPNLKKYSIVQRLSGDQGLASACDGLTARK